MVVILGKIRYLNKVMSFWASLFAEFVTCPLEFSILFFASTPFLWRSYVLIDAEQTALPLTMIRSLRPTLMRAVRL